MGIDLDNLSEEDYLSALMEATNALTIKNPDDPRIGPLVEEIKKVRKEKKKSESKKLILIDKKKSPEEEQNQFQDKCCLDSFFDKKKSPEEQAKPVPGQLMLPGDAAAILSVPLLNQIV